MNKLNNFKILSIFIFAYVVFLVVYFDNNDIDVKTGSCFDDRDHKVIGLECEYPNYDLLDYLVIFVFPLSSMCYGLVLLMNFVFGDKK